MRILLVITCSFGLALYAGAAQHDDHDNNQGKKKGGKNAPSQQAVTQQPGGKQKFYKKAGPGSGSYNANVQQPSTVHSTAKSWHGPITGQGNLSTAKSTTFNKTTTLNKNITVNKNTTFKVQHFNLGNQANAKYQAVKFNGNFHIAGAQNWKGSKYVVFKNYHPEWHDQWWWTSHHNHVVFLFGGWYFWNAGYWCPAWGYDPGSVYYYDGPIYASNPEMDPGQVVANVQSALQQQGYYQGEIDGILGPQTRAALAEYQSAQGLEPTGAVDEPTLETLGMA